MLLCCISIFKDSESSPIRRFRNSMTEIVSLDELAQQVPGGIRIGIGGVHLARLPIALIEKVLNLGRKDFTYISWGGGLPLELFLEAEALKKLVFCFLG